VALMCGNGIRCVARHLADAGQSGASMLIDTDSGPRLCTVHRGAGGQVEAVTVEMGPARLEGEQVFTIGDEKLRTVRVNMGNPHAVLFEPPSLERAAQLGPAIERQVPGGVNVGLARPGPGGIELVVWERGSGLTAACGTGACAAAVASVKAGLAQAGTPLAVRLPGGVLTVTVAADLGSVLMRGPAEKVYQGETGL
jgi:diaminopimelate epimerase